MIRYTIRCVGFDDQQQDLISAIIDLAGSALINEWRFSDEKDSDVVMVNMNSEAGKQMFLLQKELIPNYRIIVSGENNDDKMQDFWFLNKKPIGPPSLRELTDLFNRIGTFLSELGEEKAQAVTDQEEREAEFETEPGELTTHDGSDQHIVRDNRKLLAKHYLFGLVLQAEKDKSCRIIGFKKQPLLYISPEENYYFFDGTESDLNALCLTALKQLKIKKVSKRKLLKEEKKEGNAVKKPLAALKVQAIIQASQGRILEGHSPEANVTLEKWPDFDTLEVLVKYRKVAEYMLDSDMNLFTVAENMRIPLSDVYDFYNVCYLLGDLKIDNDYAKQQAYERKKLGLLSFFKAFSKKNESA